jgi:Asp-tRNA(Asn)/Glu-tRNA(Gln) amidotransferase A subunit family amidase
MKELVFSSTTQLAAAIRAGHVSAPAVVLPYTLDRDGLPIGVQMVGKRWGESRWLSMAAALSEVTGAFQRPPGY